MGIPAQTDSLIPQPNATLADLVSFSLTPAAEKSLNQTAGKSYLAYAFDHPQMDIGPDVYLSIPNSASLAPQNNTYEVISWGYDSADTAFGVLFETPAAAESVYSLDIISHSPTGPTPATFKMIEAGVLGLNNALVTGLWKNVTKLVWDEDVDGMAWPVCNASCRANEFALAL